MMAPENSHYMEPEKNSIPSKNSRCFDFCFPKRFCHCCCSIQVGLIQSQVFFLLCGIFSIVIGYLHTANMVMGSIMIVLAVMALFATVWKSCILAPLGVTIAVIGIVNTVINIMNIVDAHNYLEVFWYQSFTNETAVEWIFFGAMIANSSLTLTLGLLIAWNGLGLALWLHRDPTQLWPPRNSPMDC